MPALREHAPRHLHLGCEPLELLERARAVERDDLAQAVAALEARRVGVLPQRAQGSGLLQPLGGLLGPAGNRCRFFVAHAIVSGSPRTRLRMASRTPFTNAGESASPKRLASSTASSRTTAAGVSRLLRELVGSEPQDRAVDRRDAVEAPVRRGGLDLAVELVGARLCAERQPLGHRLRRRRAGADAPEALEHGAHRLTGDLPLVQDLERALAGLRAAAHASSGARAGEAPAACAP